jgi:hypothetical protein
MCIKITVLQDMTPCGWACTHTHVHAHTFWRYLLPPTTEFKLNTAHSSKQLVPAYHTANVCNLDVACHKTLKSYKELTGYEKVPLTFLANFMHVFYVYRVLASVE